MATTLRQYQADAVNAVYDYLRSQAGNPCVVLPTGCHAAGHPILMFDGSIKSVERVAVGDLVMGPDSLPRKVVNLCRGSDMMYRIVPKKGDPFVVNGDHVLSLVCTSEGKGQYACQKRGGEIDNLTVREYLTKAKYWKHLRKLYRKPVEFADSPRPALSPWAVGALLGDGHIKRGVSFSNPEKELLDALWAEMQTFGLHFNANHRGGCWHVQFSYKGASRSVPNPVFTILRELGIAGLMSDAKFVPDCYKISSREVRLGVLAGLLDTDGSLSKSGYDFISKSQRLSNDVAFIARSLGLSAYVAECVKRCQNDFEGTYWRVSIYGDVDQIPMRCTRKKAQPRQQKKNPLVTGFAVEELEPGDFYGFTLDGDHLYLDGTFTVHHNSGKTHVIKQIVEDAVDRWGGRVLVLAHVKELLEQAADKLTRDDVGIYSAGLGSRDKKQPIIIAGIQSVYNRAAELGAFNLILIDECHLLPPDGEGMYQTFLKDALLVNPKLRLVGFTATPYRMSTGLICGPENLLTEICYEASIPDLIVQGYLSPVRSKQSRREVDLSSARIRGGEYQQDDIANLMDADDVVERAVEEIRAYTRDRTSVLVFASSVRHAMHLETLLPEAEVITGDTPSAARADRIQRFKDRRLKYLINVNVLSTGFDAPNVDAICLLRPTLSPGLYYQQVGRGLRLCEGKSDALILDFSGNVKRHGPIDQIRAPRRSSGGTRERSEPTEVANTKTCPQCQEIVSAGFEACPSCDYKWPFKHNASADETPVLSIPEPPETHVVRGTSYAVHYKKDAQPDAPRTLRVDYQIGLGERVSEWVCIEHDGFAGEKARAWWRARCHDPFPEDADLAVAIANAGGLAETLEITTKKDGRWHRVVSARVSEKPVPTLLTSADLEADDF